MRTRTLLLLASLPHLLLLRPAPLQAMIEGSPHDLSAQGYDAPREGGSQEQCKTCHFPIVPDEINFLDAVPPSLSEWGRTDLACFSCHDGTTIVSRDVDASTTAFHPGSHSYGEEARPEPSAERKDVPAVEETRLSCVSCHDPHENGNRPFLRFDPGTLCASCHGGMASSEEEPEYRGVNHPLSVNPLEEVPPSVPISVDPAFREPLPSSYPLRNGKFRPGVHWRLGGHLQDGSAGNMLCITCHAVHGTDRTPPVKDLLSLDPVNEEANLFCEGCHRGTRGDSRPSPPFPNPGGTSEHRTYHPCDDDAGGRGRAVPVTRQPADWPFGEGASRSLLCTTCHPSHGGWPGSPLLRTPVLSETFCGECHQELTEYHHPVGVIPDALCERNLPGVEYGDPLVGMVCEHCHRAHNAGLDSGREQDYVPILRFSGDPEILCLVCHPAEDPTCRQITGRTASHFLGDPTLVDTYEDLDPPLRTDPWPESGALSFYGGEDEKIVTCLSCHTFSSEGVISGDDGTVGYLLARSGNPVEWGEGEQEGEENGEGEQEADEAIYLCTGCHTANPATKSTGHTHPLMSADISLMGKEPLLPVTATPGGRVNCDSCHLPHNAPDAGGYYILEVVEGPNKDPKAIAPRVNFTKLCHACHEADKY